MTLYPDLPKWGHEVTAQGTVTGAGEGDIISIDWGDGTSVTEISPVPESGDFTTPPHVYDKPISVPDSQKTVVAKLLNGEVERASTEVLITIKTCNFSDTRHEPFTGSDCLY